MQKFSSTPLELMRSTYFGFSQKSQIILLVYHILVDYIEYVSDLFNGSDPVCLGDDSSAYKFSST